MEGVPVFWHALLCCIRVSETQGDEVADEGGVLK
jgi:hypothetical protein